MSNACDKPGSTYVFRKTCTLVPAVFVVAGKSLFPAVIPVIFLVLCPAVPVSAGETVEFDSGLVPGSGGEHLNLWRNAQGSIPSFHWGDSLVPTGPYLTGSTYWSSPRYVHRSNELNGNTIIVYSGLVSGCIFGALDDTLASDPRPHDVTNNRIIIYDGQVGDTPGVYSLAVEGTSGIVTGGWTKAGDALNNRVEIYGGTILNHVRGGSSGSGHALGNSVLISGGDVKTNNSDIEPGLEWYNPDGTQINPLLRVDLIQKMVDEGTAELTPLGAIVLKSNVYGGMSSSGDALRNTVTVTSGSVGNNVYGGHSTSGKASENIVNISGGTVGEAVYGGWSRGGIATSNQVTISGNTVIYPDAKGWGGYVYGGYFLASGGVIESNEVTLSGNVQVKIKGLYGGSVFGGYAEKASATIKNNKVTLGDNVLVEGEVAGGYSEMGGAVTFNSVTMNGGTVQQNVYGGYSYSGSATDNTVNLNAGTVMGTIYGGNRGSGSGDIFTGNSLNVNGFQSSVGGLANFENYNFIMPGALWPNVTTQVHISRATAVDLNNTHVALNGKLPGSGGQRLHAGDYIILIDKTTGTPASRSVVPIRHGLSWIYHFRISVEDVPNNLVAILDGVDTAPEGENPVGGHMAALAFLNRGADLDPLRTARCTCGTFVTLGGNWNRYNAGGQIDVDGLSLKTGYSTCTNFARCKLQLAPFFEVGAGEYDTFNVYMLRDFGGNVVENNAVNAHGRINYYGGGLLTKFSLSDGLYFDSSLRFGGLDMNYDSADLRRISGVETRYDMTSMYAGMHIGMGREWNISNQTSLDVYGRYYFQHLTGGTVSIGGDSIQFSGINSNRFRLGGRANHAVNKNFNGYLGAAWEHEFSGTARVSLYEYTLGSPSLRGDTGVGEVGLTWKPAAHRKSHVSEPLNIDLGVQGYTGIRDGIAANLQVRWER